MTRFVSKATPIGYIDSKCHIKRLSSKTCLIDYSGFICIMFRGGHTYVAHLHRSDFKKPGVCRPSAPGLKINISKLFAVAMCTYIKTKAVLSTCLHEAVGSYHIWQDIRGRRLSRFSWFFTPQEYFIMNSLLAIDILIKQAATTILVNFFCFTDKSFPF